MEYFNAFLCGGILCLIGQLLIDKTPLTPAKILVLYVVTGVVLGGAGVYQKLVDWAGSGATVPLTGFGYLLAKGAFSGTISFEYIILFPCISFRHSASSFCNPTSSCNSAG